MENLPYYVNHELRSFHPPQKEPLCICAPLVWRINTCSLAGSPVPFHYIKWYKSISNILNFTIIEMLLVNTTGGKRGL